MAGAGPVVSGTAVNSPGVAGYRLLVMQKFTYTGLR